MYTTKLGICIRITYTLFRVRLVYYPPSVVPLLSARYVRVAYACALYTLRRIFEKILSDYYTMYKFPCTLSHLYVARSCTWVVYS